MSAVVVAAWLGASAAMACSPPQYLLPEAQRAELLRRQERALGAAEVIVEYEVVRAWDVNPLDRLPPYDGDTHVELRPVRTLRGDRAQEVSVELVHQRHCGLRLSYSTEAGTLLLAYSGESDIDDASDFIELIPTDDIIHPATLEILAPPR